MIPYPPNSKNVPQFSPFLKHQITNTESCHCLQVSVYQIDRSERRHRRLRELAMPGQPQCMQVHFSTLSASSRTGNVLQILHGKLCVGYPSGARMWDLVDNAQHGK